MKLKEKVSIIGDVRGVGLMIGCEFVDPKGKPIKGKDGKTVLLPKDTLTLAQHDALVHLLQQLKEKFPNATVHGHNEFASKACPCFDVQELLRFIQS